jgi:hypothetical protein
MKFTLAIFWLFAGTTALLAQSGVSNQRDIYGNVVRSTGPYSPRGINQGPVNNGTVNTAPAQPPTSNARMDRGTSR